MVWVRYCFAALAICAFIYPAAHAHHLWVTQSGEDYVVARGLIPDRIDAYNPEHVTTIRAFDRDGKEIPVRRMNETQRVLFKAKKNVAMATVTSEWGNRVNTTKGKKFMTRGEAQDAGLHVLDAFFSTHCAKSFLRPVNPADKPVGMKFEIVPLEDSFRAAPRAHIPIKLLFDGKPLAGASIFTSNGQESETDKNGIARFRKSGNERQLIYSRHRIAAKDREDLDYLIFTTFLTIEANR